MAAKGSSKTNTGKITPALFNRITEFLSRKKILIPLGIILFALPAIVLHLDGIFDQFQVLWRILYVQPTIILYILILTPLLQRTSKDVVSGLRPIVQLTEEEFNQVVAEKSRPDPRAEYTVIVIGLLVGYFMNFGTALDIAAPFTKTYKLITNMIMYTGIIWALYLSITSSGRTKEIYRQPIEVDIFDLRPFEPIGRESLMLSFAFIVGATIATAFMLNAEMTLSIGSLIVYIIFALMTIIVFYATMIDTYKLLSAVKKYEINTAKDHISLEYQSLKQSAKNGESIHSSLNEMNAWIGMKERLDKTQTWPHSTAIVGRLLISSLMPAVLALLRQLANVAMDTITLQF